MVKAGIPLIDKLGRPVGIHTFRRTFISQLQKAGVHPRVIMQLARHKSLRLTDTTYTDTTLLPLAEGIESLAHLASQTVVTISPCSSPRFSGRKGVSVSKSVQAQKPSLKNFLSEVAESEETWRELDHVVQSSPNLELVPGVGVEPTRL